MSLIEIYRDKCIQDLLGIVPGQCNGNDQRAGALLGMNIMEMDLLILGHPAEDLSVAAGTHMELFLDGRLSECTCPLSDDHVVLRWLDAIRTANISAAIYKSFEEGQQ